MMTLKWYKEHYGYQKLECLPRDERTGSDIADCSISKFIEIADAGHHVSVRSALCPTEWRRALEDSLRENPFSPLPEYSAVNTLPFVFILFLLLFIFLCFTLIRTGTVIVIDCVK